MKNGFEGLGELKEKLINQQKEMGKMFEQFTGGDFQDKLKEIMYMANKESEKRIKIKKKPAQMILTKSGEVVFKFDDMKEGKIFFDSIK